jgi:hypothetical protein
MVPWQFRDSYTLYVSETVVLVPPPIKLGTMDSTLYQDMNK